jgi:S1-C subfamily serine protease
MLQENLAGLQDTVLALGRGARRGCGLSIGGGRVVTLSHLLSGERVELHAGDGERRAGRRLGVDRAAGVAVLEVDGADAPEVRWAEAMPAIGADVTAAGNPGSGLRVTEGRVSAAPVTVRARHGRPLALIEHTAPLPRGAGGGPLLDGEGAVLGLNALRGDPGFLLAVPAAAVRAAVERIVTGRQPARLGVALASPEASRRMRRAVGLPDRDGLLVRDVEQGSAAETAGVLAGDLLVELGGVALATVEDLYRGLDAGAGQPAVGLGLVRATDELALSVDLSGARA